MQELLVVEVLGDGDDVTPEVPELDLGHVEVDLALAGAVLDLPLQAGDRPVEQDHAVDAADLKIPRVPVTSFPSFQINKTI